MVNTGGRFLAVLALAALGAAKPVPEEEARAIARAIEANVERRGELAEVEKAAFDAYTTGE